MIRVVRLGTPRVPNEGVRLGTVRRPPRGVPKTEHARRDFYDVWVPDLAPSPVLFSSIKSQPLTDARWRTFARRYRAEMKRPEARRLIELLAALSKHANFSIGCYCETEARCHRSLLRDLFVEAGANVC
ncbi:MAG TPA: DUF488 family protein [Gemmatimonadales bacterium]